MTKTQVVSFLKRQGIVDFDALIRSIGVEMESRATDRKLHRRQGYYSVILHMEKLLRELKNKVNLDDDDT